MELTLKQQQGLNIALSRYKNHEKYTVISGYAGTGKAQPNDTIIPTPNGKKQLGEIKIGDEVYNRYGKPVKVTGVFPQGELEVFKVTLGDGRTTFCNDEHIWSTYTRKGNLVNHTLKELMQMGFKSGNAYKFKIPNMQCIDYPKKEYQIDPYVIGAFLGDGCCKETYLTLSSEDDEIPNLICELTNFKVKRNNEKNFNWSFYLPEKEIVDGKFRQYKRTRPQTLEFLPIEVCKGAKDKSIPEIYKLGSKEQRYSLLQGLFDTDGSISYSDGRYNVRFTSISYQLTLDIKDILNSLGYQSITITTDKREEKYNTNICYGLNVNIPNEDKPLLFRMKRKHELALQGSKINKRKDYTKVSIYSAEDMGYKTQMTCIMVDDPEHLYVTNDYIVTHNTTLVKSIVEALDVEPDKIAYATFCGKAAEVLRKKGNKNAITLHRLLYESIPKPNGGFFRRRKKSLEYKIIVVDEVSLVPKSMIELLLSYNVHIIFLGDHFQLPQINKDEEHTLLDKPHIFLDQIMRQAEESEIIRLTMKIRNQEKIDYYKGNEVMIIPKQELTTGHLTWADIVLCSTNKVRYNVNNQIRQLLGFEGELQENEKIIFKRNYWDDINEDGDALVNGTIGTITNIFDSFIKIPSNIKNNRHKIPILVGDFYPEGGKNFNMISLDKDFLLKEKPCVDWKVSYRMGKSGKGDVLPKQATYGYCLTGHSAQGSEWDKVLVLEEKFPFDKEEHQRWLYTCCTRSSQKLVLVKN